MATVQESLRCLQSRIEAVPTLRNEIEIALSVDGLDGAIEVARRHGIEIPNDWKSQTSELSDLELELVTAGKQMAALGTGLMQVGAGVGMGVGRIFGG